MRALIVLGVMAPRVKDRVGVEVGVATDADTPLAVVTTTEVTVPLPDPLVPGIPATEIFQLEKVPDPLVEVEEITRTPVPLL